MGPEFRKDIPDHAFCLCFSVMFVEWVSCSKVISILFVLKKLKVLVLLLILLRPFTFTVRILTLLFLMVLCDVLFVSVTSFMSSWCVLYVLVCLV